MTMTMAYVPGVLGEVGTRLGGPSFLRSLATLQRAQVTSNATALAADGQTWVEYGADVPRFGGLARRLLIEGQRTNSITNPRREGAAAGTPGTLPTGWTPLGSTAITRSIVGIGTEDGIPYVDFRWAGTSASSSSFYVAFMSNTAVGAATGQTWAGSVFARLVDGSYAGLLGEAPRLAISERTSVGSFIVTEESLIPATAARLGSQRFQLARTLSGGASTERVALAFGLNVPTGNSVDFTVRVGGPQLEFAAFASHPILPPVGAPGASTRGADLVSVPLASMGIGDNGACTILGTFMLPQPAPSGASQTLVQISDGSNANRFLAYNIAGSSSILGFRTTAGAGIATSAAGAMTPGVPFRTGLTINGAGRLAINFEGGPVQEATGGPTNGLTTLSLGNRPDNGAPMSGEVGTVIVLPYTLPDADLAARVTALPFT